MCNYNVNVKTDNNNDGCYADSFATLDEVRVFVKASAASFRVSRPNLKCFALIVPNGKSISQGRTLEC